MASDVQIMQVLRDIYRRNQFAIDDRFVLRDGKVHKCAILCPGGGYSMVCSFVEGVPIAKRLNALGISAFIVYYRVKKYAAFPNPQDDLAEAIRQILPKADEYMVDMENYSIWGASAGGHLVGSFGTEAMGYRKYGLPKPGALILTYPVITLEKALTHQGTRENHIGAEATAEEERSRSVHTNVDAHYPPTFIWCGDADTTVPPENSAMMAKALEENSVPYAYKVYPGVEHGVGSGSGTAAEGWIGEAVAFWMEQER